MKEKIWGVLRLALGWVFFWAFIDKLFGLGFSTSSENSWLAGGSPTSGFLEFATKGPFQEIYQGMAGNPLVDWLFMLGLAFVGITLLSGVLVKLGSYTGIMMMVLMYTAAFMPPANNPFLDSHIVYIIVLFGLSINNSGFYFGFGRWWSERKIVKRYNILI